MPDKKGLVYTIFAFILISIFWTFFYPVDTEKYELNSVIEELKAQQTHLQEELMKELASNPRKTSHRHIMPFPTDYKTPRLPQDTATVHFLYDYPAIKPRAWCSIESLCRLNVSVKIITANPSAFDSFSLDCDLSFMNLNYTELYKNTPLANWLDVTEFDETNGNKKFDMTDAARLAVVYKYGGIYSDLDIIYFNRKFLDTKNKVAAQHGLGTSFLSNLDFIFDSSI